MGFGQWHNYGVGGGGGGGGDTYPNWNPVYSICVIPVLKQDITFVNCSNQGNVFKQWARGNFKSAVHGPRHKRLGSLTLKVPEKLQLYGLYVYYVVHICDSGMLRVKHGYLEINLWLKLWIIYPEKQSIY